MEYIFINENTDLSSLLKKTPIKFICKKCNIEYKLSKLCKFDEQFLCRTCKTKSTRLDKYGDENYNNREKSRQTCLDRYNDVNYNNRDKSKKTCQEKYGVDNYAKTKDFLDNLQNHNLEKYGTENYFSTQEFKDRSKKTNIKKYGVENAAKSDIIKEKLKLTQEKRFSKEAKAKAKNTCKQKYGFDSFSQTEIFKKRLIQINNEKHNVDWYVQSEDFKKKSIETCKQKYDHEYFTQTEEFKEKVKQTNNEKYGVDWYCQTPEYHKKKIRKINYDGLSFDSEWEVIVYKYYKKLGRDIKKYEGYIEYNYNGNIYRYFPDFIIDGSLYEVKGDHFFDKDGKLRNPFDESQNEKYQAKFQCMLENHITVLKSDVIKKMKEYLESA